jgi:hypothetical protein
MTAPSYGVLRPSAQARCSWSGCLTSTLAILAAFYTPPLVTAEGDFLGQSAAAYQNCHVLKKGELHVRWSVDSSSSSVSFALEAAAAGLLAPGRAIHAGDYRRHLSW